MNNFSEKISHILKRINSVTKNIGHYSKNSRTCHLLCERPGCYHNTSKTDVRDMIIKLSAIHSSNDLSDSLNLLNSVKVLLHLGKTPMNQIKANQNKTNENAIMENLNILHQILNILHQSSFPLLTYLLNSANSTKQYKRGFL